MQRTEPAAPADTPSAPAVAAWSLRLLGGAEALGPGVHVTHWPARAVVVLLARLALSPQRAHAREELVELLWPGVPLDVGRNRLRQALSTLKGLLEAGGRPPLLVAERTTIRLLPGALHCDAVEFERQLRAGDVDAARSLYRGELMPGHYDEWVLEERQRLQSLFERLEALPALPRPQSPAAWVDAGTLPSYWTRLYGVERTAARLRSLVLAHRLVTVCGAGGSGKTRLAVEVAQALRDAPDWAPPGQPASPRFTRVVFVPLVDCTTLEQAMDAIAGTLHITGRDPLARVAAALSGQTSLLVLDNFEQLAELAQSACTTLLRQVPGLHLLVTSRQRLAIDGEHLFELAGLPMPDPAAGTDTVAASPAVALFVDRARAARADFDPAGHDLLDLCELVRALDAVPLALELAASRVRSFSPRELLRRLRADTPAPMLDVLARTAAAPAAAGRHASMRQVVSWSWGQLGARQIAMLQSMVLFASPARTEAVAAAAAVPPPDAQALLESLRDRSLLQSQPDAGGTLRHVLLQPVREFAAERIAPAQALLARARLRHWLIDDAVATLQRGPSMAELDLPHVYAAILAAQADGEPCDAVALAVAYKRHWVIDALEAPPLSVMLALEACLLHVHEAALRSDASELLAFGRGASGFGREAVAHAQRALADAGDPRRRSLAQTRLAWSMVLSGRHDSSVDELLRDALANASACGDPTAQALALRMQMMVEVNIRFNYAGAEGPVLQAQRLWEQLGDRRNAFRRLLDRATCWAWSGRNDEAATAIAACERAARDEGDHAGAYNAAWQLGRVFIRLRRWSEAADAFRRCLDTGRQRNHMLAMSYGLMHLPDALVMLGQAELAARLQGFAVPHWENQLGTINRIEARELRRTRRLLRLALGPARAEALRIDGRALNLGEAMTLALAPDAHPTRDR